MAPLVLLVHFIQPQCLLEYSFTGLTFSRPEGHFLLGKEKFRGVDFCQSSLECNLNLFPWFNQQCSVLTISCFTSKYEPILFWIPFLLSSHFKVTSMYPFPFFHMFSSGLPHVYPCKIQWVNNSKNWSLNCCTC